MPDCPFLLHKFILYENKTKGVFIIMTRQEFEERTNIFLPMELYCIVESFYIHSDMDKDLFCKSYQKNTDGLAIKIQQSFYEEKFKKEKERKQEIVALRKQLKEFSKENAYLRKKIESLQCWTSYENPQYFSNEDYRELYECNFTEKLSEEKAIEVIAYTFGFSPEKINILTKAKVYEINRDKELRIIGEKERIPLYASSDWNYIYFSICGTQYELQNGNLKII